MDDECEVWRRVSPPEVLDTATGRLVPRGPDRAVVYNGPCYISLNGLRPLPGDTGERYGTTARYTAALPIASADVLLGDRLTVISSRRDAALVGREFEVKNVNPTSWAVSRKVEMDLVDPV